MIYGSDSSPDKPVQDDRAAADHARAATDSSTEGLGYAASGGTDPRGSPESGHEGARSYENRNLLGTRPRHCNFNDDSASLSSDEKDACSGASNSEKLSAERVEQRTIAIRGLSDRTTHQDITEVVRGGALLEIFLRARDRMASISFVEGSAAQEFLNYAKRRDIYIAGKRVSLTTPCRTSNT